ncbi:RNA metabolism protein [Lithospermum erythrorhizon]|uniref:RNA metabolism protein n=1 Tax=Lithospermum erythrorhizon TaxID=34254 RepID=A0AAV3Q1A4_LITER
MATASNPSHVPPHHSPRPSATAATHRSPQPRRSPVPRGGDSSPWTQIVRGIDSESNIHSDSTVSVSPQSPSGDIRVKIQENLVDQHGEKEKSVLGEREVDILSNLDVVGVNEGSYDGLDNGGKKTVWDKPSPADIAAPEVVPLLGVAVWPALSESTKVPSKSSSSESLKNLSQGSSSVPQGTGMPSSSQRQGNNTNTNSSLHTNHPAPTRQRSFRRGNGGSSGNPGNNTTTNGGFPSAPPPQGFGVESVPNNTGRPGNSESLSEENPQRESGAQRGGFGPQSNSGGEHQQRNSYRRGNSGPHSGGEGSQYHNHGGRRDQDRGNNYRNPQRNFGGRGAHMQPQRGSSRPFIRGPPHSNASYAPPPPILMHPTFGTPMVYPGPEVFYFPGPHQDPYRTGPMVPPMGPMFYPFVDPVLQTNIVNQIEYYFSTDNLVGDTYLRKNMDEQGWVSIKLIAGFKKVSQLTDNIQLILAALQTSRLVEIEGEKLRRRDDWERWIIPSPVQQIGVSSPRSIQESGQEMLAMHLQNVALEERRVRNVGNENHPSRASPGELSSR